MPFSVEITAFGETLIHRELLRFADNLANPRHALEAAGNMLRDSTRRQFDTEGGNSGGWAPLKASTIAEKRRHPHVSDAGSGILIASGALVASLTRKYDPRHVERLSGDSLTFGSTVPYGAFHQTGTSKMPRRPPVALTEADKVALVKELQAALLEGVTAGASSMGLAA